MTNSLLTASQKNENSTKIHQKLIKCANYRWVNFCSKKNIFSKKSHQNEKYTVIYTKSIPYMLQPPGSALTQGQMDHNPVFALWSV